MHFSVFCCQKRPLILVQLVVLLLLVLVVIICLFIKVYYIYASFALNFSVLSSDDSAMETHFRHCANLGQKMSASASWSTHEKLHPSVQFSPNTFSFETDRWCMHSLLHQHAHDPSPREAIFMPPQTLL